LEKVEEPREKLLGGRGAQVDAEKKTGIEKKKGGKTDEISEGQRGHQLGKKMGPGTEKKTEKGPKTDKRKNMILKGWKNEEE